MTTVRVIRHGALSAARNMAIDESLALTQEQSGAMACLRFYRWEHPAISAGYFEDIRAVSTRFDSQRRGWDVVRRLTGGGSVLHGKDLTFSLTMRLPDPRVPSDVKDSYLKINEAIRLGLKGLYPLMDYADCRTVSPIKANERGRICFDAPSCYDLLLNGKKVLGASQRRLGPVLLHQSTLFLPHVEEDLTERILSGFQSLWGGEWIDSELSAEEERRTVSITETRYSDAAWSLSAAKTLERV